jgi:hypothetical protein
LWAQNIATLKWLPTTYAPGLSKTATYAACYMDRFNYKYGPPSYFLLASSLLQHANQPHNFLTQPSLNYLSPPKDHLLPARFCSHFQLVSRLYVAVLPLWPSSSPSQAGCRRYDPSNAALPSTMRLTPNLFDWGVDMLIPDDRPATVRTAEHYRQYR